MTRTNVRLWLAGSVLLAVLAAPFLVQGNQDRQKTAKMNLAAISALSQTDREHLMQNFSAFEALPAANQQAIRDLHARLAQDAQQQSVLNNTLHTYYGWLKTLEPYQREELQSTTDPTEKLTAIRRVLNEQTEKQAQADVAGQVEELQFAFHGRQIKIPVMGADSLARVMQTMEDIATVRLSSAQQVALQSLNGMPRYVKLLELIREQSLTDRDPRLFAMGSQAELDRVQAQIEESEVKDYLARSQDGGPFFSRFSWHVLLRASLLNEMRRLEHEAQHPPSTSALEDHFAKLPVSEQDRLLSLTSGDFIDELTRQFLELNAPVNRQQLDHVFSIPEEVRNRLRQAAGGPPRPGDRPPFDRERNGGRPGERPPGDRPPGERDGDPFRRDGEFRDGPPGPRPGPGGDGFRGRPEKRPPEERSESPKSND